MQKTFVLFVTTVVCLCWSAKAFCQKSDKPFPPPPRSPNDRSLRCTYQLKYSTRERMLFYPFNQAKYVKLISFKAHNIVDSLNIHANPRAEYNIIANPLNQLKAFESVLLSKSDLVSLTDIFYNYVFIGKEYEEEAMCYEPRNAIVFYDEKGIAFERIEICFECNQYKKSSERVKLGKFCVGKYKLLYAFFRNHGIKYGVE